MDVFTVVRACIRRWYILLPLLAITAVVAILQGRSVKATYSDTASLIVLPSTSAPNANTGTTGRGNPLVSTFTAQQALIQRLNSVDAFNSVASKTGGSFTASLAGANNSLLLLQSSGTTANQTVRALSAAATEAQTQLTALQKQVGAPSSSYYRLVTLNPGAQPAPNYPHRSRSVVLIAIAGLVISAVIAEIFDASATAVGRRRRRGRHDTVQGNTAPGSTVSSNGLPSSQEDDDTSRLPMSDDGDDTSRLPMSDDDDDDDDQIDFWRDEDMTHVQGGNSHRESGQAVPPALGS